MFAVVGASAGVKVASARLPSPKTMVGSPAQILAQFPKQHSPKQLQQSSPLGVSSVGQTQTTSSSPGSKPTIQIKQESGKPTNTIFLLYFFFHSWSLYPILFYLFISIFFYLYVLFQFNFSFSLNGFIGITAHNTMLPKHVNTKHTLSFSLYVVLSLAFFLSCLISLFIYLFIFKLNFSCCLEVMAGMFLYFP